MRNGGRSLTKPRSGRSSCPQIRFLGTSVSNGIPTTRDRHQRPGLRHGFSCISRVVYGYFPAPDLDTVSHTMHPKPLPSTVVRPQKPGTLNSGSKPWTRIETGSHVLFMTLDSITIGAAQDRHYSPAEPPHTKAYSTINPFPLLPQPNGSKQQGTWVLLFS